MKNKDKRLFLEPLHSFLDKNSVNERAPFPRVYAPLVSSPTGNEHWRLSYILHSWLLQSTFLRRRSQKAVENSVLRFFRSLSNSFFRTLIMGTDRSNSFISTSFPESWKKDLQPFKGIQNIRGLQNMATKSCIFTMVHVLCSTWLQGFCSNLSLLRQVHILKISLAIFLYHLKQNFAEFFQLIRKFCCGLEVL